MFRVLLASLPLVLLSQAAAEQTKEIDAVLKELEAFGKKNARWNVRPITADSCG